MVEERERGRGRGRKRGGGESLLGKVAKERKREDDKKHNFCSRHHRKANFFLTKSTLRATELYLFCLFPHPVHFLSMATTPQSWHTSHKGGKRMKRGWKGGGGWKMIIDCPMA